MLPMIAMRSGVPLESANIFHDEFDSVTPWMLLPRSSSRIAPSLEFGDVSDAVSRPDPPGCPGGGGGGCGPGGGGGVAGGAGGGGGGAGGGCWRPGTGAAMAVDPNTTRLW